MTYYRRRSLEWWEELAAVGAGLVAGAAGAYLARQWLRRTPAEAEPGRGEDRLPAGEERPAPAREGRERGS